MSKPDRSMDSQRDIPANQRAVERGATGSRTTTALTRPACSAQGCPEAPSTPSQLARTAPWEGSASEPRWITSVPSA